MPPHVNSCRVIFCLGVMLLASPLLAQEPLRGYPPPEGGGLWPVPVTIEYYFDTSLRPGLNTLNDDIRQAAMDAVDDWDFALQSYNIPISFHFNNAIFVDKGGQCPQPPFKGIVFRYAEHDLGTFYCVSPNQNRTQSACGDAAPPPDPGAPSSGVGADTNTEYAILTDGTKETQWSVIEINSRTDWNVQNPEGRNLRNAIRHEIGHSLGLAHLPYDLSQDQTNGTMAIGHCGEADFPIDSKTLAMLGCLYGQGGGVPCVGKRWTEVDAASLGIGYGKFYLVDCRCGGSMGPLSQAQTGTNYELGIGDGTGAFTTFAVLNEQEWFNGSSPYAHVFSHAYHQAIIRLLVIEGGSIVDESWTWPAINVAAPAVAVNPDTVVRRSRRSDDVSQSCVIFGLTNQSVSSKSWRASTTASWLSIATASGTIPPSGSQNVTVCMGGSTPLPVAGSYSAPVTCEFVGDGDTLRVTRWITLVINPCAAVAQANKNCFRFNILSGATGRDTLQVTNSVSASCAHLQYQIVPRLEVPAITHTDAVGNSTAANFGNQRYRGTVYLVNRATVLTMVEGYLNFTGARSLNFVVFEGDNPGGPFSSVFSRTLTVSGTGATFYSSGPLTVQLKVGKRYVVAVGWSGGNVTFYWNPSTPSQNVSFGVAEEGYLYDGYPIPLTVNDPYISQPYCQRLRTDDTWLVVTNDTGDLSPGGSGQSRIDVNGSGKSPGTYVAYLDMYANSQPQPARTIPVAMVVCVSPGNCPSSFDCGLVSVGTNPEEGERLSLELFPNPYVAAPTIRFRLKREGYVHLEIFDAAGRRRANLIEGVLGPGRHEVPWPVNDGDAQRLSAGVYLCRLSANGASEFRKVVSLGVR